MRGYANQGASNPMLTPSFWTEAEKMKDKPTQYVVLAKGPKPRDWRIVAAKTTPEGALPLEVGCTPVASWPRPAPSLLAALGVNPGAATTIFHSTRKAAVEELERAGFRLHA